MGNLDSHASNDTLKKDFNYLIGDVSTYSRQDKKIFLLCHHYLNYGSNKELRRRHARLSPEKVRDFESADEDSVSDNSLPSIKNSKAGADGEFNSQHEDIVDVKQIGIKLEPNNHELSRDVIDEECTNITSDIVNDGSVSFTGTKCTFSKNSSDNVVEREITGLCRDTKRKPEHCVSQDNEAYTDNDGYTHVEFDLTGESHAASNGVASPIILFVPFARIKPLYCHQTFVSWRSKRQMIQPFDSMLKNRRTIFIQPIGPFPEFIHDANVLDLMVSFLRNFFYPYRVIIRPEISEEDMLDVTKRRINSKMGIEQIHSRSIFKYLGTKLPKSGICTLGVTWTDLYPDENMNFVLGESSMQHRAGVFCFGRYEYRKFQNDGNLTDISSVTAELIWKIIKVSAHEICHAVGMDHCFFFQCAMNESACIDDAMQQPLFLCPVCLRKLQYLCRFGILDRYVRIREWLVHIKDEYTCDKFDEAIRWLDDCILYLQD